jgi:uncharacterized membrane protein
MKMTVNAGDRAAIQDYVNRISASLKGIDESQKQEIRAEINSHLIDRCVELTAHGAGYPVAEAIAELGDPVVLAAQFMAQAQATHGIRGYAPWTLLHRAARVARSGITGFLLFLTALFGYGITLAGLVAIVLKPFIPGMGLWVGDWGFVWGVKPDGATGRELLGPYFIPATIALSFLFGSGTTLFLRRVTKKIAFFGSWPTASLRQPVRAR